MKKRKLFTVVVLGLICCLGLTACSTSADENTGIFFSEVGDVLDTYFDSGTNVTSTEEVATEEETGEPLESPGEFAVDEDGNYLFRSVENADYYMIYFCAPDAEGDDDNYLFSSAAIEDDGSDTYTGNCFDLFEYAYDEYLAKVVAFPKLTDEEHVKSSAATCSYTFSGEQSIPQICYMWDIFSQTFSMQITNIADYKYQAYPDEIRVTFTDTEGGSEDVELTFTDISEENYSLETTALKLGVTYDVTAVAVSSNEFVTNQTTESASVGQVLLGENNQITDGYYYHDGIKAYFGYPLITESFNLESGGFAGNYTGTQGVIEYNATPKETSAGSAYSYVCVMTPPAFMQNVMGANIDGTLELYTDGTFLMTQVGGGPLSGGTIQGTWTDNGDGTAVLNFDHSTVTEG